VAEWPAKGDLAWSVAAGLVASRSTLATWRCAGVLRRDRAGNRWPEARHKPRL